MGWVPLPGDRQTDHEPVALGGLLDAVLAGLGAPSGDVLTVVYQGWSVLVGSEVALHAKPVGIVDGRLKVVADSPAWASHLRWAEAELLDHLAELVGADAVTSVSVRVAST